MQLPRYIQFETNTKCDAHCWFCPHDMMKPREEMSNELIQNIIREVVPHSNNVCPFLMQEPMLEPRLPAILQTIKHVNPDTVTWIYTTGRHMTEHMMHELVDRQDLNKLVFSYANSTPKSREMLMELIEYRGERLFPQVEIHCIEGECGTNIPYMGREIVRNVPLDTFHGTISPRVQPSIGPNTVRRPCSRLWETLNIHSNGVVVPCCVDWEEEIPLGKLNYEKGITAQKIWNSYKFMALRQMHLDRQWDQIPMCKDCQTWRWM